jgi:hypothetical protein
MLVFLLRTQTYKVRFSPLHISLHNPDSQFLNTNVKFPQILKTLHQIIHYLKCLWLDAKKLEKNKNKLFFYLTLVRGIIAITVKTEFP